MFWMKDELRGMIGREKIAKDEKDEKGEKKTQKKSPFEMLIGKEVVIQLLRGVIIEGTYVGEYKNYFILTEAEITGAAHICRTQFVLVQKGQVSHLHLKGEVQKKGG